jgi:hypothetical protein
VKELGQGTRKVEEPRSLGCGGEEPRSEGVEEPTKWRSGGAKDWRSGGAKERADEASSLDLLAARGMQ